MRFYLNKVNSVFFINFILATSILFFSNCKSSRHQSSSGNITKDFFPNSKGSKWVYADSIWKDKGLVQAKYDTISVVERIERNNEVYWTLSDHQELMERNDSIFTGLKNEMGKVNYNLSWYPVRDKAKYTVFIDSDAGIERMGSKLDGTYNIGPNKCSACYRFVDNCESYTIVAAGTGIIESKKYSCTASNIIRKRTLISFKNPNNEK